MERCYSVETVSKSTNLPPLLNHQFTCGGTTSQNETTFVNPNYPRGENGTETCQVTIEKTPNVCQLRLDFEEFTLAQPDENGLCTTDSFMVRTTVGERLPILCGDNSAQHSEYCTSGWVEFYLDSNPL